MIEEYIIDDEEFDFKKLVDKIKHKYYEDEYRNYDINADESYDDYLHEKIRKKTKNKKGNIGTIINKIKGSTEDENDLNKVRYMLFVLEENLGGSLKLFFNEEQKIEKNLGIEDESKKLKLYNIHLTNFRKALENYISDDFKIETLECVFTFKKHIEVMGLLKNNYDLHSDYILYNEYLNLKKWLDIHMELKNFNNINNLKDYQFNIYENLYFYLLKLEQINNLNVCIDIIEQMKNMPYSKEILKDESKYKIVLNEDKVEIKDLRRYLSENIALISEVIYNKKDTTKKEREKILQQYNKIILFNNAVFNVSLMNDLDEYKGVKTIDFVFKSFIIVFIKEILIDNGRGSEIKEYVRFNSTKSLINNKSHKQEISISSILNKNISDLSREEKTYLMLKFQRRRLFYLYKGFKWNRYLEILSENFIMGKYFLEKSNNPIQLTFYMCGIISEFLDKK